MVQRVSTVAFEGIEARAVDVQVQVAPGLPAFAIVGPNNPGQNIISRSGPTGRTVPDPGRGGALAATAGPGTLRRYLWLYMLGFLLSLSGHRSRRVKG